MPAHALLPAVNRLLQQVEEVSGLPVAVAQQSDLEHPGHPAAGDAGTAGSPDRLPRCR